MCYHLMAHLNANMESFTIRDLRERTGELVRACEQDRLSLLTKHGRPLGIIVPMDETLLKQGVATALAVQLFKEHTLSLGLAAKVAGMTLEEFMDYLGSIGVPVIDYDEDDLARELSAID